jgi:hypothetical protein
MPAAYQDQNGKWWKECSSTKQLFGGVDTIEELSEWFHRSARSKQDGFYTQCKKVKKTKSSQYYQKNKKEMQKQHLQYNDKKLESTTFIKREHGTKKIIQSFTTDDIQQLVYESTSFTSLVTKLGYSAHSSWVIPKIKSFIEYNNIKCEWAKVTNRSERIKRKYRPRGTGLTKKDSDKEYHGTAKGLFTHYKRSAKKRKINFTLTIEWFEEQLKSGKADFCSVTNEKFVLNQRNHSLGRSLDRTSSTKGYTPDNVVWMCFDLNRYKSDLQTKRLFKLAEFQAKNQGYDPVEYMQEVMNNNSTPHLTLMKESA